MEDHAIPTLRDRNVGPALVAAEVTCTIGIYVLFASLLCIPVLGRTVTSGCRNRAIVIVAGHLSHEIQLDAAHPAKEWAKAVPVTFCSDWQGRNADPQRQTTVRVLWSAQNLYLRFECRYRDLYVFDDANPNGRRDHLWERDVAEAFVQPDPLQPHYYKEFEVAPNGFWIDLDISPAPSRDLKSGLQHSTFLDERQHRWCAELAIPLKSLTSDFNPSGVWRANFYRVDGREVPRLYSAWRPTHTPEPNFHVPSAFGELRFAPAR